MLSSASAADLRGRSEKGHWDDFHPFYTLHMTMIGRRKLEGLNELIRLELEGVRVWIELLWDVLVIAPD